MNLTAVTTYFERNTIDLQSYSSAWSKLSEVEGSVYIHDTTETYIAVGELAEVESVEEFLASAYKKRLEYFDSDESEGSLQQIYAGDMRESLTKIQSFKVVDFIELLRANIGEADWICLKPICERLCSVYHEPGFAGEYRYPHYGYSPSKLVFADVRR